MPAPAFLLPPCEPPADLLAVLPATLSPCLATAAATAWTQAPFLKGLLRGRRHVMAAIAGHGPDAALADALTLARDTSQPIMPRLRAARRDVALTVAMADLAGLWPLERVTAALSDFTDLAIDLAVAEALAERGAANRGLAVLALGKLGSHELNYSSDADLILTHQPDLIPCRTHEEPDEAAVRIARRAVAILADLTPDGYVCRVDLRLRPASEVTPMTIPVAAAEHYYQSEALTWERVAFVRARACAGDLSLGQGFLDHIRAFVWRRSLDFTAVRDIQSVSLRIRDHLGGADAGPGFDVKRGRGGIREVEFFTQIHQLIRGGRDPALRAPATLDGLAALAHAGYVPPAEAQALGDSYRFLRTLEHRLQMRRDEQTHAVPRLAADRKAVAALSGYRDWAAAQAALARRTAPVAHAYDQLIAAAAPVATAIPADPRAWLKTHHRAVLPFMPALLAGWRAGRLRALRSEAARADFEIVLPALIAAVAGSADPPATAARLDAFLAALPQGAQFFALLGANPRLIGLLGNLLGVSPVLAGALARDPALFDVMLSPDAFAAQPGPAALTADWLAGSQGTAGLEDVLDRMRRWTGEHRFALGAQLVEGNADPLVVARGLANLADVGIRAILPAVEQDFARQHGMVAGGQLVVLALGRLGGRALTHASDLDLVFLFTGGHETLSDGSRPLPASLYFNRLAARLTTALSVPTAAGALYEIDTRLRPWGAKGMLAVSVDSFARYHADEAEDWEHMALTRARVVAGPSADAEEAIASVLTRPRPGPALARAVTRMRADIAAAKPPQGKCDVKLAPGGLVDLEFLVHFRQRETGIGLSPELPTAIAALTAAGLLPPDLGAAHDVLTRLLVLLRLVFPGAAVPANFPAPVEAFLARAMGAANFAMVEQALLMARQSVKMAWKDALRTDTLPRKGPQP
ncbi:bifunctional [glutamate--ammonia ligase]-adenylyl-L-tyrosine phosphorylase/[glutamate--ammonia-ligase] adenylyltransferase [Sandarakinorhabdus sp.]|uniref:bifunctional [glutamate--ammonia ligase]-adenylyl-L-tyrosine phosphorylase/[glutamate--ammonia-ligase] adenylyltransferase n=1 Tax=Sandarakinorhabdus sp. TaxID=1916663 RepID=UPI00286E1DDF|nr:bifunctional [glutamate--ammonia ligase]-adenylyl-L-tyrosine phosphorylase/[glutamate--ammonia-ligase] adenylyltransferase [Sandarakinorhabdus sp.]